MSRNAMIAVAVAVAVLGILGASALFTVHQTQQALVLQFGEPKREVKEPGLHVKLPFVQNVVYFDLRVLDFSPPAEEVIAADQKRLVVDSFARFRIVDPLRFFQTVGNETGIRGRLNSIMSSALRGVIGNVTLAQVISAERADIMSQIRDRVDQEAERFGIEVVDVRLRRTDLPEENNQAIYARMQSEREREAREFRAQGAEVAQRIRSRADRERTVIVAEARKQSQILRGEGDGQAVKIYADAFGKDPQFFAFTRSMEAYTKALSDGDTSMVLSPESDFFRYFNNITGGGQNR